MENVMFLNGKSIVQLNETDVLALLGQDEDQLLDFKHSAHNLVLDASSNNFKETVKDKWKRDLCTDVCAFVNASGGWIICGIEEQKGKAVTLRSLDVSNEDAELLQLRQCIKNGIKPIAIYRFEQPISGICTSYLYST